LTEQNAIKTPLTDMNCIYNKTTLHPVDSVDKARLTTLARDQI